MVSAIKNLFVADDEQPNSDILTQTSDSQTSDAYCRMGSGFLGKGEAIITLGRINHGGSDETMMSVHQLAPNSKSRIGFILILILRVLKMYSLYNYFILYSFYTLFYVVFYVLNRRLL